MFDLKENSARFGKCQYCETSCEHVCCACKALYCGDSCIAIDWNKHSNYCKPRTVHIDNYEKFIQNRNCYSRKGVDSVREAKDDVKTSKETTPLIPSDKYTKIVISWIDEPIYWAFRLDDADTQAKIEAKLDVYCNSFRAKKMSLDDNKCCAPFDGAWYRAKILSINEDMAVVKFIDFGNDATIKLSDALKVPEELQLVKPLAFQVKFPYGKPNTITLNIAFDVKAIKMDVDICEVKILGYTKKSETSVSDARPPTVSVEDSFNVHDMVERNDTSDKSDLQKSFNNQQRQDSSLPRTVNEREKISTKAETPLIPTDRFTKDGETCEVQIQRFPIKNEESLAMANSPSPTVVVGGSFNRHDGAVTNSTSAGTTDHKFSIINEKLLEALITSKIPYLPTDKITKIVVSWVDKSFYWAFNLSDVHTHTKIEEILYAYSTSTRARRISPDEIQCCAPFRGGWFRAEILSKHYDSAVVRLIDFGNDASIKLIEALKVPEELSRFMPLAFKVRFANGEPPMNTPVDIIAIKQDGDICEVRIHECQIKSEASAINLPPPTVSAEDSFNGHNGAETNCASTIANTNDKHDVDEAQVNDSFNKLHTSDTNSILTETTKENANKLRNLLYTRINERDTKTDLSAELNKESRNHDDLSHINVLAKTTCTTDDNKVQELVKAHIPPIPTDRFTKIVVSWVDEPIYWVFRLDDAETQTKIEQKLIVHCTSTRAKLISPDDNKCCAPFDGGWYRAQIMSKDNDTAVVKFIDFGNDASIKLSEALKLPEELTLFKPLAFQIRFPCGKPNTITINDAFDVKAMKMDSDICEAQIQGFPMKSEMSVQNLPQPTISISDNIVLPQANGKKTQDIPKETTPPRIPVLHYSPKMRNRRNNHLVYQIEPSLSTVSVQAQTFIGENCTTGFILVDDTFKNNSAFKSIKEIAKELSITKADPEFKPSLKDEVCARVGGIWYRGLVTLINPDKTNVALVDLGVIVVPDELAPLPQHVKSIAETAVRCIFSTFQKINLVGEQIVLQHLQKEAGKLTGDTDKFGQVAIIPWEPTCEDAGLISENIKSGILYKLTAFHSPNEIYLQSKEQNQILRLTNLIRDVATYSLKAPLLIRKPWCGQLVSCLSLKNNMYSRAQVLKKMGDRYEVKYIDSGLIETVSLSNFKPLSDKLKSVPCFVTKVGLKGIPGSSFNNEAIKIMNQLMDKDSLITVGVENNDPTKIRLFEGKNDINKLIYEVMLPSWSSRNKIDSVVFMSNDIMYEKWLNGQNMRLTILLVKAFNEIVVLNEQSEVFTHVVNMTTEITHFCSSDTTPYNPCVQEMCLAKFQDEIGSSWYRALCSASYENSATVYLIDFGNFSEVSHKDIRKIPPEFLDFPAASKTCKIYGLSDSLPDDIKEDIANVYTDNYLDSMVVCDNNDGSAVLYVPKLMDIIAQHNLTSINPPPTPFLIPASNF